MLSLEEISIHQPVNSPDEWLALCRRYRGDAQALRDRSRPDGAWMNAGFAIECCLKAAIMKKEGESNGVIEWLAGLYRLDI
jgi:hypothetical protein